MQLTRKQLNQILLQLPPPQFVLEGRISPTIKVPVFKTLEAIHSKQYRINPLEEQIKEITFEYSHGEMDWVLKDLEI